MEKIFITGANGQLGYEVIKVLQREGLSFIASGTQNINPKGYEYVNLDITDCENVESVICKYHPDIILHFAAYTFVDLAEEERDKAYQINVVGTRNIAKAAQKIGATVIYISTDYVFGGIGELPHYEDTDDLKPKNYYGLTKLLGEEEIKKYLSKYFILRVSWLYGHHSVSNFVDKMLDLSKNNESIRVVNDQIGLPTYARDLADLVLRMIKTEKYGTYNVSNSGEYISWYDFACKIYELSNISTKIIPIKSSEFNSKAQRPYNSRISLLKLEREGFGIMPRWDTSLLEYLREK